VSILSPNGVIFYTDGSLLNGQAGAGVYSESLEIGDAYLLAPNQQYFNRKYTQYSLAPNNVVLYSCEIKQYICSDSRASLLALSSYTISSSLI
jgi:hypothetical protein